MLKRYGATFRFTPLPRRAFVAAGLFYLSFNLFPFWFDQLASREASLVKSQAPPDEAETADTAPKEQPTEDSGEESDIPAPPSARHPTLVAAEEAKPTAEPTAGADAQAEAEAEEATGAAEEEPKPAAEVDAVSSRLTLGCRSAQLGSVRPN